MTDAPHSMKARASVSCMRSREKTPPGEVPEKLFPSTRLLRELLGSIEEARPELKGLSASNAGRDMKTAKGEKGLPAAKAGLEVRAGPKVQVSLELFFLFYGKRSQGMLLGKASQYLLLLFLYIFVS